ncbi:hypothetical protein ACFV7R_10170 [Streptomyces sp. NPDC059866]|uniref:hypothetical protein n=1 Tax=Streptomyces sp. NPDC059866 TaxID=3346978 RepID=UPI00365914DF
MDHAYEVKVVFRCRQGNARYLKGSRRGVKFEGTVKIPERGSGFKVIAPVVAVGAGADEELFLEKITITPRNGYARYLPRYESDKETVIRIDCRIP